jgi:uncharacterized protein YbjT (DUF2867 family)
MRRVCVIGASGKLGRYMVGHCLERGYEVVAVCRVKSVGKLDGFKGLIELVPGDTNDREVVRKAVAGCDGILAVLVPWGRRNYASGTARAALDFAQPGARIVFSCGWHISRDGLDVYPEKLKQEEKTARWISRLTGLIDIDDQIRACGLIFESKANWTVVRGSDLEEGTSQGMPAWAEHVGDPGISSNMVRRTDFALFMVEALANEALVGKAPAIARHSR